MQVTVRIKNPVQCPYCRRHAGPHDLVRYTVTHRGDPFVRAEFVCARCDSQFIASGSGKTWPLGAEPPESSGDQGDARWEEALDRITTSEGAREFLEGLSSRTDEPRLGEALSGSEP